MKNISFMGAVYSDVPAVILPDAGGGVARFDDASITTATASDVASGKVFLASDGTITTGTSSGGGGSSSWTKVCEKSYQVTYSSSTIETVEIWATGHSELWTKADWIYVRIRDTEGKRNGYFYGTDEFFYNMTLANSETRISTSAALRLCMKYDDGLYSGSSTNALSGYGVWADKLYSDGRINIRKRYNSGSSGTIDGTYKVEVYLLDPAGGVPIFE